MNLAKKLENKFRAKKYISFHPVTMAMIDKKKERKNEKCIGKFTYRCINILTS